MSVSRKPAFLDWLTLGVLVATAAYTAAVYPHLPDPMPTHFDGHGVPNGWMSRANGAWSTPAIAVGVVALVRFGAYLLRREWRERLRASPVGVIAFVSATFLGALQLVVLRAALTPAHRLGATIWVLLGAFFVVLGLVLPRTRRNPWIGVRTPWSMRSDENWARTHRVAGYSMAAGGLVAATAGLCGAPELAIGGLIVSSIVPVVWSRHIHKTEAGC